MPVYQSAGVYVVEKDLSQVVPTTATSVGAIVLHAKRGPIGRPVLVTNTQEYINNFGNPHPNNGYGAYAALAFLERSNQLYVVRVVEGSYAYAGVKASVTVVSGRPTVTTLTGVTGGQDPAGFTFASGEPFFMYPVGPGAYGNSYTVSLSSMNLTTPSIATSIGGTGGVLAAGPYYYKVTAVNSKGQETDAAAGTLATIATLGEKVTITITRVEGTAYYRVYGRPATVGGTYTYLDKVSQPTSGNATFVDDGSIVGTTATIPSSNFTVTNEFKISIYDRNQSTSVPIEEYDVCLDEKLDGFGQQMEIETRVNTFSKTFRVVKNTTYVDGAAGVLSAAGVDCTGGTDGDAYSAISAGAFEAGWDLFADPEAITVRILIEGGTQQAAIQLKMNSIAQGRKDCVAVLDVPTAYQDPTQAVVYRRDVLNINSNRAAIYAPDLKINDPYNDLVIYVPPSGHVAAVYAFTDFSAQVWYAPAGLNRGTLNVLGVRYKYNQAQRDILAPSQVNYVRNFPGLGIAVWEQTTLQSKTSALSFMNVRRMLDIIEVSVSQALLYSNYEPNDDFLKRQIVTLIAQFLEVIKNGRGIADYAVISDSSNNPPQIANQGQLNVDVYIQPILPARIIQLQMIITKQGVSFQELIASGGNV